jgi:deoxycytidine triphosphate deaminase
MATVDDAGPQAGDIWPPETEYADSPEEAELRSVRYRDVDPFPDIPRALLSSEHIKAYVRQTGMIHPFDDDQKLEALKSASYEVRAGGQFIYWDKDEEQVVQLIRRDETFTLPANSISYVQIGCEFRLPQYIAVRFNLRITHVHRGLLLGTGPLVDPGFHGRLLVPLHNLTSDKYTIRGDEGLIWMEFTKTSHLARDGRVKNAPQEQFDTMGPRKNNQPPHYYFDKANKNRPIRSSIRRGGAARPAPDARISARVNLDFSNAGGASGLRIWENRCAAAISPRSKVRPDADRVYPEAIRI